MKALIWSCTFTRRMRFILIVLSAAFVCSLGEGLVSFFAIFSLLTLLFTIAYESLIGQPLARLKRSLWNDIVRSFSTSPNVVEADDFAAIEQGIELLREHLQTCRTQKVHQALVASDILDVIGVGLIVLKSDRTILTANQQVTHWFPSPSILIGVRLVDVIRHVELNLCLNEMIKDLELGMGANEILPKNIVPISIDGPRSKTLQAKLVAKSDGAEMPALILLFLFDETFSGEAEHARRAFFANVSHELKTPMAAIQGYAEVLSSQPGFETNSIALQSLQVINRNTRVLSKLIDDMLDLARLETGHFALNREYSELTLAAQNAIAILLPKAKDALVKLTLVDSKVLSPVFADTERLGSVLLNLIDNGIKYNRRGGHVTVLVQETSNAHVISVQDSGHGIPLALQDRAFEQFYRVDPAHTRRDGGSGLGLALVKLIVEAHGGTISLSSEMDVGTTVTVLFPKKHLTKSPTSYFH